MMHVCIPITEKIRPPIDNNNLILLFLHRLVLRHEFILKKERFKFERTMFAKLFDVKASLSSLTSSSEAGIRRKDEDLEL